MIVFEGRRPNKLLKTVVSTILEKGEVISPRGMPTKELQPAGNLWTNPSEIVLTTPGRKLNPFFHLYEVLWILGGRGDSESVCFYNNNLSQFLDEGFTDFHAPYGRRIRRWGEHKRSDDNSLEKDRKAPYELLHGNVGRTYDQFKDCYELLKRDPDTRQAVIVLWIPAYDHSLIKTNDRPCNDLIFFKIRNGRLNMTVCNRSNDGIWGLYGSNICQFSFLQQVLASCLGVKVGHYYHHSDSLHIYHERDDISERILTADYDFDVYDYVEPYDMSGEWSSLEEFDAELSKFFKIEEDLRLGVRKAFLHHELATNFLKGAMSICAAYIMHKQKRYEESIFYIFDAFDFGLRDHAISAMEFVMRKYQKPKVGLTDKAITWINTFFQDRAVPDSKSGEIMNFIVSH